MSSLGKFLKTMFALVCFDLTRQKWYTKEDDRYSFAAGPSYITWVESGQHGEEGLMHQSVSQQEG